MNFIEPEIKHHFSSGVYAKEMRMPADYLMLHHKHTFSHLSILASGSIELMVDGKTSALHAPACLSIAAGTAILLGVVGNWATLVSDGTNWIIMQAAANNNLLLE